VKKLAALLAVFIITVVQSAEAGHSAPRVRLETSKGVLILQLYPDKAPKTVDNFLFYVKAGFYDNTIFHRVIKGFMIQGGGLNPDMQRKKNAEPIPNEADNGLENRRGTIAMARTMEPHSATSQFFINTTDNAFLDHKTKTPQGWGYCVFGELVEGVSVMDDIENVKTTTRAGRRDVPVNPVIIRKAQVVVKDSGDKNKQ
jgi:peptidyl-prolyl cis-trans isomerase B (cyclophilin B)